MLVRGGTIDKGIYKFRCSGRINDIPTERIQLDTRSTKTSVHPRFVAEGMKTGKTVELWSTNEQKTKYPLTRVRISLDGEEYTCEAAVAADLPEDALLGVDIPIACSKSFLTSNRKKTDKPPKRNSQKRSH